MASITKNEHKSYGMGLHDEVLTGRTQQTFFNSEEDENFFYNDAFDVDFNKRANEKRIWNNCIKKSRS